MFISRKRFEAELEKARNEVAEKIWKDQCQNERFAEMNQRIDRLCECMAQIEKKMYEMTEGGKKNA